MKNKFVQTWFSVTSFKKILSKNATEKNSNNNGNAKNILEKNLTNR